MMLRIIIDRHGKSGARLEYRRASNGQYLSLLIEFRRGQYVGKGVGERENLPK